MIRKAALNDVKEIEDTYNEHFQYEIEHGAVTVFKKGIYPTAKDAEKAIRCGTLYVYEEHNRILGSIIVDDVQPAEYTKIAWSQLFHDNEVKVIHLLLVRPSMAGKGIASALVRHAIHLAHGDSCKAIRLDTGSQNIPAVSLYQKLGFQIVAMSSMKVGGSVEHKEHLFLEKTIE